MASPPLPLDPQPDSPIFRASLSSLDHRTHTVKAACKAALQHAAHLRELLLQVQQAEGELVRSLGDVCRHVSGQSAGAGEGQGEMDGFKRWRARKRGEEVEQLDTLVVGKLRSLRSDIKSRGAGGGGAITRFEVSVAHPSTLRAATDLDTARLCRRRTSPKPTTRP